MTYKYPLEHVDGFNASCSIVFGLDNDRTLDAFKLLKLSMKNKLTSLAVLKQFKQMLYLSGRWQFSRKYELKEAIVDTAQAIHS